jgi:formylglycine-generating enzyme required for sulfatase activity
MKYEAKVDETGDGIGDTNTDCNYSSTTFSWKHYDRCPYTENNREIVSTAEGYPLAYISQIEAKDACESIGEGYHLITNEEWMTIARNIERQPENWTGGQVGSGRIYMGNTSNNYDAQCSSDGGCYDSSLNPDFGTGRDETAKLVLSNGSSIWDLSGNMWEWNDKTLDVSTAGNLPHDSTKTLNWDWIEFSEGASRSSAGVLDNLGVLERKDLVPLNQSYNTNQGIGRIYTDESYTSSTDRAVLRGGYWNYGSNAGPFAVKLISIPSDRDYGFGFRCSVVPS